KPSEKVDRIYLWVWNWLRDEEGFHVSRIATSLAGGWVTGAAGRFTVEDKLLIRNSLLWLSLFDPESRQRIDELLESLAIPSPSRCPLLDLEHLVIRHLIALRDGDSSSASDALSLMTRHPLWSSPEILFRQLVEGVRSGASGESFGGPHPLDAF